MVDGVTGGRHDAGERGAEGEEEVCESKKILWCIIDVGCINTPFNPYH